MQHDPQSPRVRGLGPRAREPNFLSVAQHNCLGSLVVLQSIFQEATLGRRAPSFVLIQDPPVTRGLTPLINGYRCFTPPPQTGKPRVATYVLSSIDKFFCVFSATMTRSDVLEVMVAADNPLFSTAIRSFRLVNVYRHPRGSSLPGAPLTPDNIFSPSPVATLVAGDFNLHHPSSDPSRTISDRDFCESEPFFSLAAERGFSLLNTPGVYTRFPFNLETRPAVLDLAFASSGLMPFISSWSTPFSSTGSDHVPTLVSFCPNRDGPAQPVLDWSRTDWTEAKESLEALKRAPPPHLATSATLDPWFDTHATRLRGVLGRFTPQKTLSPRSKPWWTSLLCQLRRLFHSKARAHRKRPTTTTASEARSAKSTYFSAVNRAKHSHWRGFLAGADHQTVWKAKRLAGNRTPTRFPSLPGAATPEDTRDRLVEHFFQAQTHLTQNAVCPTFGHCPPVSREEVSRVLARSSPSSAPGPDTIPYGVWKKLHSLHPDILPSLTGPLVCSGYHPRALKRAEGIVLDKPGKTDYDTPVSYRLIILLETLSKIIERLVANRLSAQARELGLIHSNQCGSVVGVSAFHAVASLNHEVVIAQKLRLKASTLFLDVKGGFDNIRPNTLTDGL